MIIVIFTWVFFKICQGTCEYNFIVSNVEDFICGWIIIITKKYSWKCIIIKFTSKLFKDEEKNFATEYSNIRIIDFRFCKYFIWDFRVNTIMWNPVMNVVRSRSSIFPELMT